MITGRSLASRQSPKASDEDVAGRLQFCVSMLGGITATRISEEMGVSVSAVTKWLRSGRITRAHLVGFAYRYGVNLEWLMTGVGSMKERPVESSELSLPVYELNDYIVKNGKVALANSDTNARHYVHVSQGASPLFAISGSYYEVDPRLSADKSYVFQSQDFSVAPGALAVVVRKHDSDRLLLRVITEDAAGDLLFSARSPLIPDLANADVRVVGSCVNVVDSNPLFF